MRAVPWPEIVRHYDPKRFTAMNMQPMHALVVRIAAAWWSRGVYGGTSHGYLYVAQTDPFDMHGEQRLIVEPWPSRGSIVFRFNDWSTSCPEGEAFAKLEHILRNRLKWVVDRGQP